MSVDEIIESIDALTVLELVELKDKLQEKYGVSAAAPVAVAAGAAGAAEEEEKFSFNVILESEGDTKIQVIKAVRELTSLGLREAKAVVDEAPSEVVKGVPKNDAAAAKERLEKAGATVEIK